MALTRRPAGLLPAARPGRRPRPRLGAPDDPVAADGRPRCHRPPCPPHRPALQGRPPLDRPPAGRARAPPGTPRPVDTRNSSPARHDPEGTPPWPLEGPDHRGPTRGRPPHPTDIINPTTPATTPPKPTQPDDERSRLVCQHTHNHHAISTKNPHQNPDPTKVSRVRLHSGGQLSTGRNEQPTTRSTRRLAGR